MRSKRRTPAGPRVPTADLAAVNRAAKSSLGDQIATREASLDAWAYTTWLPNPDPVLKALGRDIAVYRDLRADAHVGGCIRRRRGAVRSLEWRLDTTGCPARVAKSVEGVLNDLEATSDSSEPGAAPGLPALIATAQDGALYGYQPIELTWSRVGALLVPTVAEAKPPEWFQFDSDNKLRFKDKTAGADGVLLPPHKFLLARQDATYLNPYGLPDLSLVFWPQTFRRGGSKFWASWLEKYGGTFLIGKLPRSAKPSEYTDLTERLASMIQDAVAAIPDDGSVEPLESGDKSGSSDAHERYMMYWRSEITIALLGSNQGMETSSTKASATAALDVGDDVRDGDAAMVAAAVNQMIHWVVDINWPGAKPPVWSLEEQEEIDTQRPTRDKILVESGARLTRSYWMRTYDLEEDDLKPEAEPEPEPPPAPVPLPVGAASSREDPAPDLDEQEEPEAPEEPAALAAPGSPGFGPMEPDPVAAQTNLLGAAAAPHIAAWVGHIRDRLDAAIARGDSPADFAAALLTLYPELPSAELTAVMGEALAAANLAGRYDIDQGD